MRCTRPSPPCSGARAVQRTRSRRWIASWAADDVRVKPAHPLAPYLFIAPALAVFAFAIVVPMLFTLAYSFTEWNGFGAMTPVGLDNYVAALTDPIFRDSFLHVIGYIAATLVLEVALGLALAGIVSARAGTVWFRVAFFAPVMLPMVVV